MIKKLAIPVLLAALLFAGKAAAGDPSIEALPPATDISSLPALGPGWRDVNPYRGDAGVVDVGRALFNESCAICHGVDANNRNHAGPNLLRLHRGCRKVAEPELMQRCLSDVDHYFMKSVRNGKRVLDVRHMPPWEGVMSQESMWAIKTFIEARIAESPR